MATNVSYPGVYIEEVPSGVRSIAGVPTSVAAFIGYTSRGPVNEPVQIFSFADFERRFGGLSIDSDLSYAVSHFFLNGGAVAWIVRVAAGAQAASVDMEDETGTAVLTARAKGEGLWGNNVRVEVDYATASPGSLFNLTVTEFQERAGRLQAVRTETHRNLSMNGFASNYAVAVVNAGSNLIRLERAGGLAYGNAGIATSGDIEDADITGGLGDDARRLAISIDGGRVYEFDFMAEGVPMPGANFNARMDNLAGQIEAAVQALEPANPAFSGFTCQAVGTENFLTATSGSTGEQSSVVFLSAGQRNAAGILNLGIANGGREASGAAQRRPARSGTAWVTLSQFDFSTLDDPNNVDVDLADAAGTVVHSAGTLALWGAGQAPTDVGGLAAALRTALQGVARPEYANARVAVADDSITVIPGGADPSLHFVFADTTCNAGADDITDNQFANVGGYQLGIGPAGQAQSGAVPGSDGTAPSAIDLAGSQAGKTGLYALENVDLFNILVIPNQSDPSLQATAIAYAELRRAFALLDLPAAIDSLPEAQAWLTANGGLRHRNAAAYFPRARFADPLQDNRLRSFANSGAVAGLYARTDSSRGVWKAPAGTEAVVRGVRELEYVLTDAENGVLNPLGLNALRLFPAFGPIAWGARTLVGSDALASEWKYVPVRRLALFIEESLYRGTQWVVFEPNDEPLWAQIRLNVGAFMHNLFRQGAFQGKSPREAYLVQCDSSTTTQDDINLGIVNIIVGFAPLKPAEFVIIKLQQLAGQAGAAA